MMKLGLWTNVSRVARERLSHVFRADAARETSLCPNTLKRARLKIGGDLAGRANAVSTARTWKRNVQVAPLALSLWRPQPASDPSLANSKSSLPIFASVAEPLCARVTADEGC